MGSANDCVVPRNDPLVGRGGIHGPGLRSRLEPGDAGRLDAPFRGPGRRPLVRRSLDKNRSEIALQSVIKDGTPINVAYNLEVEPGAANTAAFCILGQFHQAEGTAVAGLAPPLAIGLVGEQMIVMIGYTDASGANVTKTIF